MREHDEVLYTTPAGHRRFMRRLEEARAAYRAVCDDNEDAAGAGDSSVWHDNFAYEENQRQMHRLARRVRDLERQLARLRVVEASRTPPPAVQLGAQVRVRRLDGRLERYYIAGYEDGDPAAGRISYTSPLARALLGARAGDLRVVREAGRSTEVEVVELLGAPEEERR